MGKKETYFMLAEKYYVEEQLPVSSIATRLNITPKTLGEWKKEGDWENKRMKFLQSQYNCYSALYELVNKMTQKIVDDYGNNISPDGSTLYFIKSMVGELPKLKKFELDEIQEKTKNEQSEININRDVLSEVNKYLRGE